MKRGPERWTRDLGNHHARRPGVTLSAMDALSNLLAVWDRDALTGNRPATPVTSEQIAAARHGAWSLQLTPHKHVPRAWLPDLSGLDVLGLGAAGGRHGPILAALGANVTVLDFSRSMLEHDRMVIQRDQLAMTAVEGNIDDLSRFEPGSFDLIVNPCSSCFVLDVRRMWREAHRVLRRGGALLAGFCDPVLFAVDAGSTQIKHMIPAAGTCVHGHTLEDLIGGQTDAGLMIKGFYGDRGLESDLVSRCMPCFGATRAVKS